MAITIDGLVSGFDTESLVNGLLKIQKQQVDRLTLRRTEVEQKQAVFRGVEARLLTLRADVGRLSRTQNSPFTRQLVAVSDERAVSATATAAAASGVYRLTVNNTARAHQVASQGYSDVDAEITQGTLELRAGSGQVRTITIDGNNNSLSGLASAINSADAGVSASVVRDAAGGASPYRLLLTSTKTGTDNTISLTSSLGPTSGAALQPVFDLNNPVQAATDAEITLGSGAGAISVSSSTNRFEGVIAGLSFDLLQVAAGEELTLTVSRDTEGAVEAVNSFVKSFNDVIQYVDDQSRFNAESGQGGLLLGNRSATGIQQKLRSAVVDVVSGVNGQANRLSAIGITVTDRGLLQVNSSRLDAVVRGDVEGVTLNDVRRLFALDGTSNSPGVSFVLGSSRTKASQQPYQVDISQAAEQASLTATSALAAATVITAANRELSLTVDGATAVVTLAEGTYTRQELADHLESTINSSPDLVGRKVRIGLATDRLRINSETYGQSSEVEIVSGTALTDLGFTAGQSGVGRDVAGNFVVNGQTEAAVGRGRLLSGSIDNGHTADLQLRVTLSSAQITPGVEAEVNVTRGIGAALDQLLGELLLPDTGLVATADEGFSGQIESIQASISRQQAVFDRQQTSLLQQFAALEASLGQLKSTSSFVSAQLAGITSS